MCVRLGGYWESANWLRVKDMGVMVLGLSGFGGPVYPRFAAAGKDAVQPGTIAHLVVTQACQYLPGANWARRQSRSCQAGLRRSPQRALTLGAACGKRKPELAARGWGSVAALRRASRAPRTAAENRMSLLGHLKGKSTDWPRSRQGGAGKTITRSLHVIPDTNRKNTQHSYFGQWYFSAGRTSASGGGVQRVAGQNGTIPTRSQKIQSLLLVG